MATIVQENIEQHNAILNSVSKTNVTSNWDEDDYIYVDPKNLRTSLEGKLMMRKQDVIDYVQKQSIIKNPESTPEHKSTYSSDVDLSIIKPSKKGVSHVTIDSKLKNQIKKKKERKRKHYVQNSI